MAGTRGIPHGFGRSGVDDPEDLGYLRDLDLLAGLLGEVRAIQAGLSRTIDRAERLETKFAKMLKAASGSERHWGGATREVSVGMLSHSLLVSRNPDGSAFVQIDGAKPFFLPPRLSDFLVHLAEDTETSTDSIVPWKSRDSVREWLEIKACKKLDSQYVNKLIFKVRLRLEQAGLDPRLIQTHPTKGVRVALKRGRTEVRTLVIGGHGW
jgi:hypothetical protein